MVDMIWNAGFFGSFRGRHLPSRFWMNANFFLPIRCCQNQRSYVLYDEKGTTVDNKSRNATHFLFYRLDGKVQKFIFPYFRLPFRGCAPLWYNGVNHFKWIEYHPNFDDWAPGPVQAMPDESDDESTFSANGDPVPNDDDSIPFCGQDFDPDSCKFPMTFVLFQTKTLLVIQKIISRRRVMLQCLMLDLMELF
jgi:hypothetical protein